MSPESARPVAAGTSMPGCQRSRTFASADSRSAKALRTPRTSSIDSWSRCRGPSSRSAMCSAEDRPAQRLLGPRLDLAGAPAAGDRGRAQLVEQHGLADAAQPGEHEGAFGPAVRDPLEDDVEGRELGVAAGQLGRALPAPGAYGFRTGSMSSTVWRSLARPVEIGRTALARVEAPRRDPPRSISRLELVPRRARGPVVVTTVPRSLPSIRHRHEERDTADQRLDPGRGHRRQGRARPSPEPTRCRGVCVDGHPRSATSTRDAPRSPSRRTRPPLASSS